MEKVSFPKHGSAICTLLTRSFSLSEGPFKSKASFVSGVTRSAAYVFVALSSFNNGQESEQAHEKLPEESSPFDGREPAAAPEDFEDGREEEKKRGKSLETRNRRG